MYYIINNFGLPLYNKYSLTFVSSYSFVVIVYLICLCWFIEPFYCCGICTCTEQNIPTFNWYIYPAQKGQNFRFQLGWFNFKHSL